jgi:predicted dehydrogenase
MNAHHTPNHPKIYRVGLLGIGFIGKVHAHGYRNLPLFYDPAPLSAKITRVVTGHRESAEKARRLLDAEAAGVDYRAVTEDPEIDVEK